MRETEFLKIGKDRIAYQVFGTPGQPVILWLHGLMASKTNFRFNLPAFEDRFFNIVPDLLGHGESDKPRQGDYGILDQAAQLRHILDELGVGQFNVVGHSLGGMLALAMAATYPDRILRAVNASGIINIPWYAWRRMVTLMSGLGAVIPGAYQFGMRLTKVRLLTPLFRQLEFYNIANCPVDYDAVEMSDAILPGLEWSNYRYLQAVQQVNLLTLLPKIKCEVLTIQGRQDKTVSISQAFIADRLIPHHQLEIVEYCGHQVMIEQALHFNQQVMNFLST
jgi:2-hydroxymuconate-semialdehyde hydrolase